LLNRRNKGKTMLDLGEFSDYETSGEDPPKEKSLPLVVKGICGKAEDQIHHFEGKEPTTLRKAVSRVWMVLTKDGYWCSFRYGSRPIPINGAKWIKGIPKQQVAPLYRHLIKQAQAGAFDKEITALWDGMKPTLDPAAIALPAPLEGEAA